MGNGQDSGSDLSDKHTRNKVSSVVAILVLSLIISSVLNAFLLADTFLNELTSVYGITTLAILGAIAYGSAYYILSRLIKTVNKKREAGAERVNKTIIQKHPSMSMQHFFHKLSIGIKIIFFASALVFTFNIFQIVTKSQYYVGLFNVVTLASNAITFALFAMMAYKFFSWYRSKHSMAILLYALTFVSISFAAILAYVQILPVLSENPGRTEQPLPSGIEYGSQDNIRSSPSRALFLLAITPPRISIALYWVATAMLLRNYSSEIGKFKFWTIMSLPIIALSIGSVLIYGGVAESELSRAILTGVSFDAVGVLFAVTFLMVARNAKKAGHNAIVHYLTLAAFGSVLFVVCGTQTTHIADWIHIPYPPFVFILSFSYLAAFLYSTGFYFSAIAIAKDASLRKSIKQISLNESEFFANIGTAEMEQGIRTRVVAIAKEQQAILEDQTGEAQKDMSEEEVKNYLTQVMKEIEKENNNSINRNRSKHR